VTESKNTGLARGTNAGQVKCTRFGWENLKERHFVEDICIDGMLTLK